MSQISVSKYDVWRALSDGLRTWSRLAERNLSVLQMTVAELRALRVLSESGPSSMVTLAREQRMTAPGMTIVVDRLERAGLARRVRSDADRRTINVVITGKGGETLKRALKLHDKFVEGTIHGITSQEMDSFLVILDRLVVAAEGTANVP
ncbi:MAG: MarR family transcriptional regulator [Candidatus Bathyarchaeia archaeon]|jgi:DNA-binding MarR family transcriptional regulator